METFHLFHLAACWVGRTAFPQVGSTPLTTGPVTPVIESSSPTHHLRGAPPPLPNSVIRAAATHMVFASRKSKDFITPQQVDELEHWTGQVNPILDILHVLLKSHAHIFSLYQNL